MALQSITLNLPDDLWGRLQRLLSDSLELGQADRPEVLQGFVLQAIERELQRRQPVSRKEAFWVEVRSLRAEMAAEGVGVDPDEIWGDVRDRSPGREVAL
jgi:hypothetical protein